jgi:hypothetical protein
MEKRVKKLKSQTQRLVIKVMNSQKEAKKLIQIKKRVKLDKVAKKSRLLKKSVGRSKK